MARAITLDEQAVAQALLASARTAMAAIADYAAKPHHERNGYVFNDYNFPGLESALRRAIGLWNHYPKFFRELMANAMRCDYSWNHPGQDYVNIYNLIREP